MEKEMENGMETLRAFLEAHWQLVITCITKGGLDWKMEWKHLQLSWRYTDSLFHSIFQSSPPFSNTSCYKLPVCLQESCQCFHSIFHSFFHSVFQSSPPFSNTSYYKLSVCLQKTCQCFHSVFHSVCRSVFRSFSVPFSSPVRLLVIPLVYAPVTWHKVQSHALAITRYYFIRVTPLQNVHCIHIIEVCTFPIL